MSSDIREKLTKDELLAAVADEVRPAIVQALHTATRTCLTCDHFHEQKELCGLYGQRPPARIIAFGCPSYVNEIPF